MFYFSDWVRVLNFLRMCFILNQKRGLKNFTRHSHGSLFITQRHQIFYSMGLRITQLKNLHKFRTKPMKIENQFVCFLPGFRRMKNLLTNLKYYWCDVETFFFRVWHKKCKPILTGKCRRFWNAFEAFSEKFLVCVWEHERSLKGIKNLLQLENSRPMCWAARCVLQEWNAWKGHTLIIDRSIYVIDLELTWWISEGVTGVVVMTHVGLAHVFGSQTFESHLWVVANDNRSLTENKREARHHK